MATRDLSLWIVDDCIQYVQRIMKHFKAPNSGEYMQEVMVSFRKNLVTGSALLKLSDDESKEIIPAAGLRRYFREQLQKIIAEDKNAALSQLHRRGLPNKAVKEEPPLVPHARINSFFNLKKIDAPNLPDDVPSILSELDAVVD
jgi:hypothetical protein